ncbi:hypothetical protein AQUCO_04300096v1 [Aquilegia coerulea]|uniref:Uncharacterized protein n=1 Tax=Aquilegia coerulea TaxID=218851 RepID=A0A2G5CNQ4_AQUCA|nr:hypothetical protein AQUCO_04300096v1 [Aquilegia coerulea]
MVVFIRYIIYTYFFQSSLYMICRTFLSPLLFIYTCKYAIHFAYMIYELPSQGFVVVGMQFFVAMHTVYRITDSINFWSSCC